MPRLPSDAGGRDRLQCVRASGANEVTIRDNAIARMKDHGVTPINWTTVAAELQRNWTLPSGQALGRVFHDHYQSYGLPMDSFDAKAAARSRRRPSRLRASVQTAPDPAL